MFAPCLTIFVTDTSFTDLDFSEGSHDDAFKQAHEPDQAYNHIQFLHNTLDCADTDDTKAAAQVDLFRACMQYTEEFLIYLLAHLNTDDSFVHDLVKNDPRAFCESYRANELDEHFADHDFEFEDRLKALLSYTDLLDADPEEVEPADGEPLSADELTERVDTALNNFYAYLDYLTKFYYEFIDMYNAVKHGNKYYTVQDLEITFSNEGHEFTYQPNTTFATFLCKVSKNAPDVNPYIVNCPLNFLVTHSLSAAEVAHMLLSNLDDITTQRRDDDDDMEQTYLFSAPTPVSASESGMTGESYIISWSADTKNILPKTDQLANFVSDQTSKLAVRLTVDGGEFEIRTNGDKEVSQEYPIQASISLSTPPGPKLEFHQSTTFNIDGANLDLRQYSELKKWKQRIDGDGFQRSKLIVDGTDLSLTMLPDEMDPIEIDDTLSAETAEGLALAQDISETYMPLPPSNKDQINEIVEAATNDPQKEDVVDAIERAQAMHEHNHLTQVWAESPSGGEVEILGLIDGCLLAAEQEEQLEEERSELEEGTIEDQTIPLGELDASYEQYLENVRQFPRLMLTSPIRAPEGSAEERETCSVEVDVDYHVEQFWCPLHKATIRHTG